MNQIDNAPLSTPLDYSGDVSFLRQPAWSKWLSQIVQALYRPTVSNKSISFPSTAAQKSSDAVVKFPTGTVALNDLPVMQSPAPPSNTCFTCHIAAVDQVTVRFNNYSNAAVSFPAANFSLTILKQ